MPAMDLAATAQARDAAVTAARGSNTGAANVAFGVILQPLPCLALHAQDEALHHRRWSYPRTAAPRMNATPPPEDACLRRALVRGGDGPQSLGPLFHRCFLAHHKI